ncbi:MAG: hypothetical protein H5U01_18325 [Clostridia bacterium]|nr:hypothetical protein [Clostridia bacterium]
MGAPAGEYVPRVAGLLGTRVLIPPDAEVGSAVGAATAPMTEQVEILVQRRSDETYVVYAPWGRGEFTSLSEARSWAVEGARYFVKERVRRAGGNEASLDVEVQKVQGEAVPEWKFVVRGMAVPLTAIDG